MNCDKMETSKTKWRLSAGVLGSGMCSRGQAASETLVLAGFALAFIVPFALLFLSSSNSELSKSSVAQAKVTARAISDTAGEVYLQGTGARISMLVYYPEGVKNITVGDYLVVLTTDSDGRAMDTVSSTFANISGNLSASGKGGMQRINFEYITNGSYVNITSG